MNTDDQFAHWAALFADSCSDIGLGLPAQVCPGVQYSGVTPAACMLLQDVDAGGVPAFVTSHLKQIACDNGIDVPIEWTPNDLIAAIKAKANDRQPEMPPGT